MNGFRQEIDAPRDFVAPTTGGVTSSVPVIIGGEVVVPQTTEVAGAIFAGKTSGIFNIAKATGFVPVVGQPLYFDFGSDKRAESSGTPIGICALPDDGTVYVTGDTRVNVAIGTAAIAVAGLLGDKQFTLTPPSVVVADRDEYFIAPFALEFDSIDLFTSARPSSAAGTVVETITNLTGSLNVLAASNVELEAGIVNGTLLTPALSATLANKRAAAGDVIRFRITSTNADVVAGSGIGHRVKYHAI